MRRRAVHLTSLRAAVTLACAAVLGCGGADGDADDQMPGDADGASDDDGGGDGSPARGLKVEFAYLDSLGDRVSGDQAIEFENFRIFKMTMQLHNLEFIADTVESGEQVDSSCVLEFPWTIPPWSDFPTAPPGIYAHLGFAVDRTRSDEEIPPGFEEERLSIRVVGEALVEPSPRPFEYRDEKKVIIDLNFEEKVSEVPATRVLELDLERWFRYVPWQELADGNGNGNGNGEPMGDDGDDDGGDDPGEDDVILIKKDDPTALLLRTNLKYSFQVSP